jgi:hypothetical protein
MSVNIPGTGIRIGGSIDRLDLAGDRSRARVTDYKSGRLKGRPPQLKGGAELQRCLYAYAVTVLLAERPQVEAQLLYARKDGQGLQLENPEAKGRVEAVIDWKSDVDPTPGQIEIYHAQVRDYLAATGAQLGLVVLLTSNQVERISI